MCLYLASDEQGNNHIQATKSRPPAAIWPGSPDGKMDPPHSFLMKSYRCTHM